MKKVVVILVVMFGFMNAIQAQKVRKGESKKLTVEQKTELVVKKMILKLDLTSSQVGKIKPLIAQRMLERQEMKEKRKAFKESGKKPTADERFAMQNARLDKQIAFKVGMKRILKEKQYEKFEKMQGRMAYKMKKGRRGKRGRKGRRQDERSFR